MKYFSMFSGVGGFEKGIEQAHDSLRNQSKRAKPKEERECTERAEFYPKSINRPACVGYSEIDKYASAIYSYHYPNHKNYGDATAINVSGLPDFDLLVGGFPCQAFSVAGKRQGFKDTRGTLFFDVARVLEAKRPEWVLLENVKGLCSHESGKTLATIYRILTELGYTVGWQVVNSCQFGVPQNRERIFIIGHLTGNGAGQILPVRASQKKNTKKDLQQSNDIAGTLNTKNNSGQLSVDKGTVLISDSGNGHKFEERGDIVPNLRKGTASGYHNYVKIDKQGKQKNQQDIAACLTGGGNSGGNHSDMDLLVIKTRTDEIRTFSNNIMGTLRAAGDCGDKAIIEETKIRRLTPIECERLQGFPEIQKKIKIELCLDHQKNYVNAEGKNHKSQKLVGSAEKTERQENARYVEPPLSIKHQQIKKHVAENVLINLGESTLEVRSAKKSISTVRIAENEKRFHRLTQNGNFALLNVGIHTLLEKIAQNGKEELLQNEHYSIHRKNGGWHVKLYGKEIMQLVKDVEKDLSMMAEKLTKSTTSSLLNTKSIEQLLVTLFSCATDATTGFTQTKIKKENISSVQINHKHGWTKYGIFDNGSLEECIHGKTVEISDTQRYKALGNAVTVNVVEAIMIKILRHHHQTQLSATNHF